MEQPNPAVTYAWGIPTLNWVQGGLSSPRGDETTQTAGLGRVNLLHVQRNSIKTTATEALDQEGMEGSET